MHLGGSCGSRRCHLCSTHTHTLVKALRTTAEGGNTSPDSWRAAPCIQQWVEEHQSSRRDGMLTRKRYRERTGGLVGSVGSGVVKGSLECLHDALTAQGERSQDDQLTDLLRPASRAWLGKKPPLRLKPVWRAKPHSASHPYAEWTNQQRTSDLKIISCWPKRKKKVLVWNDSLEEMQWIYCHLGAYYPGESSSCRTFVWL